MKKLNLKTEIDEGLGTDVNTLFEGPGRKLVQITLRGGGILKAHKSAEPITVQCVAGKGLFVEIESGEEICLEPGVLLTVEADVVHEVRAEPEVSILLTKFKND